MSNPTPASASASSLERAATVVQIGDNTFNNDSNNNNSSSYMKEDQEEFPCQYSQSRSRDRDRGVDKQRYGDGHKAMETDLESAVTAMVTGGPVDHHPVDAADTDNDNTATGGGGTSQKPRRHGHGHAVAAAVWKYVRHNKWATILMVCAVLCIALVVVTIALVFISVTNDNHNLSLIQHTSEVHDAITA